MGKSILQFIAGILFFILAKWFASDDLRPELFGMAIGITAALTIEIIYFLFNERKFIGLYFNSIILKPNSEIRLSIAYLFRIEHQGKYLLVKNCRFENHTYQPVGGVYKYFHPEANDELNSMEVITDNSINNDKKSEFDLRIKMTKRKHLRKFLKWFSSSRKREISPWREFQEELIDTSILPQEFFKYIYYDLVGQHFEPIHFDNYFKVDTFKYVDIFTPRFICQKQKEELGKLVDQKNIEFIWVTEDEIKKKFSNCGKRISDHAYKIFFNKKFN